MKLDIKTQYLGDGFSFSYNSKENKAYIFNINDLKNPVDVFKLDTFSSQKVKSERDLIDIIKKKIKQTSAFNEPRGKNISRETGISNPLFNMFELGDGEKKLYTLYDLNGNRIGDSSYQKEKIFEKAERFQTEQEAFLKNQDDKKASKETTEIIRDISKKTQDVLGKNLAKAQEKENLYNKLVEEEILDPPKEEPVPETDSAGSKEEPAAPSLWDSIKNIIPSFPPSKSPNKETPSTPSPSRNKRKSLLNKLKSGEISIREYRELDNKLRREEAAEDFEQMLKGKQGERRQTLDRFDTRAKKNDSLLEKLESYEEGVSKDLTDFKQLGKDQSQKMQSLMPGDDFNLDWGVKPTFENARDIWNKEFAPNYKFSSDKPFNQKAHELALSGQSAGSSSVDANQREKMGARTREELENMAMIQNMLLKQQVSRGVDISDIQSLGKGAMGYQQQGLDTQSNIMNPIFNQQQRAQEQGDDLARMRSEADTTLSNQEIRENAQLYDFLEAQRQQEMQDMQGIDQLEFQTEMEKLNIQENALKAERGNEEAFHNLWAQRAQIYDMLKRTGFTEQAAALQKADRENKKGEWIQLIASLAQTAGAVVGTIYGGPAGGAAGGAIGSGAGKLMSDLFKDSNTKSTYEAGGKGT
jgi:hypothetical protein